MKFDIRKYEGYISLSIGLILILVGMLGFLLGFHNFDISQNLEFIEQSIYRFQLDNHLTPKPLYYETTLRGDKHTDFANLYREGLNQAFEGILLLVVGMFFIGYGMRDYFLVIR